MCTYIYIYMFIKYMAFQLAQEQLPGGCSPIPVNPPVEEKVGYPSYVQGFSTIPWSKIMQVWLNLIVF